MPLDLPFAYRQSESRTPIVLLYTQEANMVEKMVIEGAQKKQVQKLLRNQLKSLHASTISDVFLFYSAVRSKIKLSIGCKDATVSGFF